MVKQVHSERREPLFSQWASRARSEMESVSRLRPTRYLEEGQCLLVQRPKKSSQLFKEKFSGTSWTNSHHLLRSTLTSWYGSQDPQISTEYQSKAWWHQPDYTRTTAHTWWLLVDSESLEGNSRVAKTEHSPWCNTTPLPLVSPFLHAPANQTRQSWFRWSDLSWLLIVLT